MYYTLCLKTNTNAPQQNEYKRPAGAYPLYNFHEIYIISTTFQDALAVKIWLELLEGL